METINYGSVEDDMALPTTKVTSEGAIASSSSSLPSSPLSLSTLSPSTLSPAPIDSTPSADSTLPPVSTPTEAPTNRSLASRLTAPIYATLQGIGQLFTRFKRSPPTLQDEVKVKEGGVSAPPTPATPAAFSKPATPTTPTPSNPISTEESHETTDTFSAEPQSEVESEQLPIEALIAQTKAQEEEGSFLKKLTASMVVEPSFSGSAAQSGEAVDIGLLDQQFPLTSQSEELTQDPSSDLEKGITEFESDVGSDADEAANAALLAPDEIPCTLLETETDIPSVIQTETPTDVPTGELSTPPPTPSPTTSTSQPSPQSELSTESGSPEATEQETPATTDESTPIAKRAWLKPLAYSSVVALCLLTGAGGVYLMMSKTIAQQKTEITRQGAELVQQSTTLTAAITKNKKEGEKDKKKLAKIEEQLAKLKEDHEKKLAELEASPVTKPPVTETQKIATETHSERKPDRTVAQENSKPNANTPPKSGNCDLRGGNISATLKGCIAEFNRL